MKYFSDTDTAHVEFTDKEVRETKETSENFHDHLKKYTNKIRNLILFSGTENNMVVSKNNQQGLNEQMHKSLSRNEIINMIKAEKSFLKENFGVLNIGIFGSYAKDQQTPESDIDFLVEFAEPRFDWIAGLNGYMEKKFDRKIEIIRKRTLKKSKFFERIEREVIYV